MGIEYIDTVYDLATELRKKKIIAEVYPDAAKLKKQFQYADRRNFDYVVIFGENEKLANEVSLKKLSSGEESKIEITKLLEIF